MSLNKKIVLVGAIAATGMIAPQTLGQVSQTINLTAHVAVLCNVQLQPFGEPSGATGLVNLGMAQEFCNSPRGYRVILQHPSHMTGAAVFSGANRIPLSDTGETVITDSDRPAIEARRLALDLGDDPQQISRLGLRIEVKY